MDDENEYGDYNEYDCNLSTLFQTHGPYNHSCV